MAHSKSALKRWRQSLRRRDRNRSVKSHTRTLLNKALVAIETDASTAETAVRAAVSALDRAAQKGVIHSNAAARGKSRLLKRYNLVTASAVARAAAAAETEAEKPRPSRAKKDDSKPAARGKKEDSKPAARRNRKT